LERIDDERPRWEQILKEKLPEKLAELQRRSGERRASLKGRAEKILGERVHRFALATGVREDPEAEVKAIPKTEDTVTENDETSQTKTAWGRLLGGSAQKHIEGLKGGVEGLKSGLLTHVIPESSTHTPSSGQV
jgi:hypothetical protein